MTVVVRERDLRALGLDPARPEDQAAAVLAALGRPCGPDDVVVSLRCFCPVCEPSGEPETHGHALDDMRPSAGRIGALGRIRPIDVEDR